MKLKYVLVFTAIIALTSFCSAQGTTPNANTSKNPNSSTDSDSGSPTTSSPTKSPTSGSTASPSLTAGKTTSSSTGYTPVPTAEASDIANLPKFTYNLITEEKPIRENICSQNNNYCLTTCSGNAPKNFCNLTTMGWGCGCSDKTPAFKFYEWPINVEDCRKRAVACRDACRGDDVEISKRADCDRACNIVYAMQCGTPNQVLYDYEVNEVSEIPSYSSKNDPGNPSADNTTNTSSPTDAPGGDEPLSGASIQNPIIWAISALAMVAAGMMML